ncbi:MAG: hypothetical protein JNK67_32235 [Alphaproteobacteria bacterium]|nr:hypothetical protein [Alphaproteobacteria bacterium]
MNRASIRCLLVTLALAAATTSPASAMMVLAGLVETAAEPAPSDELGGAIAIIDAAAGELGRGSRVQWSGGATTQAPAIDDATDDSLLGLIPDGILLGPAVAAQQLATDLTITIRASDDVRAAALVGFFDRDVATAFGAGTSFASAFATGTTAPVATPGPAPETSGSRNPPAATPLPGVSPPSASTIAPWMVPALTASVLAAATLGGLAIRRSRTRPRYGRA